jgi:hypothetical protein
MGANDKRTPVAPPKIPAITVGIQDLVDLLKKPPPPLPHGELHVKLEKGGKSFARSPWVDGPPARAFAVFEDGIVPGTYVASAYRMIAGAKGAAALRTAVATEVVLANNQLKADVNLELRAAPELHLLKAEFLDDHGVLRHDAPTWKFKRANGGELDSTMTGTGQLAKPEYDHARPPPWTPKVEHRVWQAASYTRGARARLRLTFEVKVVDGRPHDLEALALRPIGGGKPRITFEKSLSKALAHGDQLTVELTADADLPKRVAGYDESLLLSARGDGGVPFHVEDEWQDVRIFVTLDKPTGQAEIHPSDLSGGAFPQTGPIQAITPARLALAVRHGRGAADDEDCMRKLFARVKAAGIRYFPRFSYPPSDVENPDGKGNSTGLAPRPDLHHYLWLSMAEPKICHCLDLAAAFRLLARSLGVKGSMKVVQAFPWAPWDQTGKRRDLTNSGEPWHGSLRKDPITGANWIVFIDGSGEANNFEGALRWKAPGASKAMLLAVGEKILEGSEDDDRNASLFFQSPHDERIGFFPLAVRVTHEKDVYLRPPFSFIKNKSQVRFKFEYETDTFFPGDDKTP